MNIIPIRTERVEPFPSQHIEQWILDSLRNAELSLEERDVLVLSSKIVSYFEGGVIKLDTISPSEDAQRIAAKTNARSELIQLAMDEADKVIAETPWVLLTMKNGIYTANSGVDVSNVPAGYAVIWPKNPYQSASAIRTKLMKTAEVKKLAVIIIDSVCTPGRKGAVAVSIGYAGLDGHQELKGTKDLFDNVLRYSALNRVDSLATAANLLMGESNEKTPIAIIRGYEWSQTEDTKNDEMMISSSDEMFPIQ